MRTALVIFMSLLLMSSLVKAQDVVSLKVKVDPSGYASVEELVELDNYSVVNTVPLLSNKVDALMVLDENGEPLFYNLNGSLLEIVGNATMANITYYTPSLTSKSGEVWTISFSSEVPVEVVLPKGAIITDLSDIPIEITDEYLIMPPGNVSVSYILPPPTQTTTNKTAEGQPSVTKSITGSSGSTPWIRLVLIGVLIGLISGTLWYFKNKNNEKNDTNVTQKISREELEKRLNSMDLNKEEREALLYIYDRGGIARQSDVRNELGIPKTTAWRMFQRLERQGLVRVYKKGRENWVKLTL